MPEAGRSGNGGFGKYSLVIDQDGQWHPFSGQYEVGPGIAVDIGKRGLGHHTDTVQRSHGYRCQSKAAFAIILGEDEVKAGQAMIRDLSNSQQLMVNLADVPGWLKDRL